MASRFVVACILVALLPMGAACRGAAIGGEKAKVEAVSIPPGGRYDLDAGKVGRWVDSGVVEGLQEYRYQGESGGITVRDAAGATLLARVGLRAGTKVRISDSQLAIVYGDGKPR